MAVNKGVSSTTEKILDPVSGWSRSYERRGEEKETMWAYRAESESIVLGSDVMDRQDSVASLVIDANSESFLRLAFS